MAATQPKPKLRTREELMAARKKYLLPSQSTAYESTGGLKIVRGRGARLYDDEGHEYLDCVNNVCHVGHCHPVVVEAAHKQMSELLTNGRYMYDVLIDYIEELLATFPPELCVCTLVNSGSEANELALRISKTITGGSGILTLDGAYFGNTSNLVDISPYKYEGKGGFQPPKTTYQVMAPNTFRGPYRGPDAGARYADMVHTRIEDCHRDGNKLAAFIAESVQSCAGQVLLPPGYLQNVYQHVRAAGGICIADEVQVGFGRVGEKFWAFELQGVVPDIVTLGKPIGNGFPLSAVVMTRSVADRFKTGMEYFNTFGGNPVAAAVGLAVLRVIREEKLQEHALHVGRFVLEELHKLKARHKLIGDVRGYGFFLGIELVRDHQTLEPASEECKMVSSFLMQEQQILLSTDGPFLNVLKFKPPMCFSMDDARRLIMALDKAIGSVAKSKTNAASL